MKNHVLVVAVWLLVAHIAALAARGDDGEPIKAGKAQGTLINAVGACTTPSEVTANAIPLPACPAVDSSGGLCDFGPRGRGKVSSKAKDDVAISLVVSGLVNCPDGTVLQVASNPRITTNSCSASARCTVVELIDFPIPGATCVVAKGRCKLKTTINTSAPGTLVPGENNALGLGRITLLAGSLPVAMTGLLVR